MAEFPKQTVYISEMPEELRIVSAHEGILTGFRLLRSTEPLPFGSICVGKIAKILPGIQAAFVDVGRHGKTFLRGHQSGATGDLPIEQVLKEGQTALFQVVRDAQADKHAMVRRDIVLRGIFLLRVSLGDTKLSRTLRRENPDKCALLKRELAELGGGWIVRTSASWASIDGILAEARMLIEEQHRIAAEFERSGAMRVLNRGLDAWVWDAIAENSRNGPTRIVVDDADRHARLRTVLAEVAPEILEQLSLHRDQTPLFRSLRFDSQISDLAKSKVWLRSGGYLLFHGSHGMTTIDVNSGKGSGKKVAKGNHLRVNLEAAEEAARQIRLRDLSGLIVIDFVDMKDPKYRLKVVEQFRAGFARESKQTRIEEINAFGVLTVSRQNTRRSLFEVETDECPRCRGFGRVQSMESLAFAAYREIRREAQRGESKAFELEASTPLRDYLSGPGVRLIDDLQGEIGLTISVCPRRDKSQAFSVLPVED